MLTPSPLDWLPQGHLAYFILETVSQLDLSAITAHYERERRGFPPHDPHMMVALLLYAANASKHKAMSLLRMKKETERLEQKVRELLAAAERADAQEDAQYGMGRRGDKLPEELRHAQSRLARIRAAQAELLAEAQAQADEKKESQTEEAQAEAVLDEMRRINAAKELAQAGDAATDPDDDPPPPLGPGPLPKHKIPVDKEGAPKDAAQRNFTDADSRIMKDKGGFVQGYNGHIAVCGEHQIIVAEGLSNQAPDVEYFVPMLDRLLSLNSKIPEAALADAGFFSEANICRAQARGIDVYIAPARTPHGEKEPDDDEAQAQAPVKPRCRAS